jgi:hypothetical protein
VVWFARVISVPRSRAALVLALAALACRSQKADRSALAPASAAPAALDWSHPEAVLALTADEVAARAGSFEWTAQVTWTASRGAGSRAVTAVEHHTLR